MLNVECWKFNWLGFLYHNLCLQNLPNQIQLSLHIYLVTFAPTGQRWCRLWLHTLCVPWLDCHPGECDQPWFSSGSVALGTTHSPCTNYQRDRCLTFQDVLLGKFMYSELVKLPATACWLAKLLAAIHLCMCVCVCVCLDCVVLFSGSVSCWSQECFRN